MKATEVLISVEFRAGNHHTLSKAEVLIPLEPLPDLSSKLTCAAQRAVANCIDVLEAKLQTEKR